MLPHTHLKSAAAGLVFGVVAGATLLAATGADGLRLVGEARAQTEWVNPDVLALRDEVATLRREVARLRGVGGGGGASGSGDASSILFRLDEMDQQLRRLTDQVERLEFELSTQITQKDAEIADLRYRIEAIEASLGVSSPAAGRGDPNQNAASIDIAVATPGANVPGGDVVAGAAAAAGASGPGAPPSDLGSIPSDESTAGRGVGAEPVGPASYEQAQALLQAGRFGEAEAMLVEFIEKNPNDPRIGDATYFLGEAYFVQGRYDVAAQTFLNSFRNYPNASKAPWSLLKLGMSLAQLNQMAEACLTYREVGARYPDASPRVLGRAAREAERANCP